MGATCGAETAHPSEVPESIKIAIYSVALSSEKIVHYKITLDGTDLHSTYI
jgi:hypothetical protein